jgi:hypothetical protein
LSYRELPDFQRILSKSAAFALTAGNMFSLQISTIKGVDMRIVRTLIVLAGIAAFLPTPPEDVTQAPRAASVDAPDTGYFEVATSTFSDLASFCARQPGVCETAEFVAHKLELKAKYGARLIYEWASEASSTPSAVPPELAMGSDPIETATIKLAAAKRLPNNSQSTLRLDDIIPVWRDPGKAKTS